MPLFSESEEKIFGDILTDIINNTNITRASPGSLVRALSEAVSVKMGKMWAQFDLNMIQAFLDGAEGQYLNFFGNTLNIPRLNDQPARITYQDKLVKFYVDVGTFGTINSSNSIVIPAGTLISTGSGATGTIYRTIVAHVLPADQSSQYVSVESIRTGTIANVGAKQLRFHNFSNYTESTNSALKVVNEAEINIARDIESDTNYRFRLSNAFLSSENANAIAVRLSALSVPGVADLVSLPYYRGIGTFDLLIKSTTPNVSSTLIATVQEAVRRVSSHGIMGTVRGPVEVGLSLIGNIKLKRLVSIQEQTNIVNAVTENVVSYVNGLDIAEELIINEIVERVLSSSDAIKNVGTTGKPFEQLFKHQPSKLNDNKTRNTLLSDITPQSDERIIVENKYAGDTPILFRII